LDIDRFKLTAHTESREFQVYALVLARSDGRLGPGLRPASAECAATIAAQGSGHGLGLHGTLMSVVGGTLTTESEPGVFTRISLALPAWAWA